MATDAYIKFGEQRHIEGDSSDEAHFYWCELRDCDFEIEVSERAAGSEGEEDEAPKTKIKKVTVKKRVDWASTELFRRCCMSWMVKQQKTDDDELGVIDQVTVEICRQTGEITSAEGEKFAFITVKYYDVRIVNYAIEMSGPEPSETITLELDEVGGQADVEYQQVDPFTGRKKGSKLTAIALTNSLPAAANSAGAAVSAAAGLAAGAAAGGGGGGGGGGAGASATTVASGNGQSSSVATTTDASVTANFPGLWNNEGFGVLPD